MAKLRLKDSLRAMCQAQRDRCYYCGYTFHHSKHSKLRPTVDHKTPLSKGGSNDRSNKVAACFGCNGSKGDMDEKDFQIYRQHIEQNRRLAWRSVTQNA